MLELFAWHFQLLDQHKRGVNEVCNHVEARDVKPELKIVAVSYYHNKHKVSECVKPRNLPHEQLHYMPSVEIKNGFLVDSFLDIFDCANFVNSCDHSLDSVCVKDPVKS